MQTVDNRFEAFEERNSQFLNIKSIQSLDYEVPTTLKVLKEEINFELLQNIYNIARKYPY